MPREQKRKSSSVWLHFVETENAKAKCAYCGKFTSIMNGSTGNLRRHLKLKHPEIQLDRFPKESYFMSDQSIYSESREDAVHSAIELQCSSSEGTIIPKSSSDMEESGQQPVAFYLIESLDERKGKEIDKQLLRIIVKDLHSFSIVEEQEFSKFVHMLNPSYTLPSRKDLSENLLSEMYHSSFEDLSSTLKDVTAVALTIDRWASARDEKFISVTAHYLNKDLELQISMLDCISLYQKNGPIHISSFLQELIADWRLSNKILAVVTDGSDDMLWAVKNCNWNHVFCFVHILNAVVEAGLAEIDTFLNKVRTVIEYFKTLASNKFHAMQRQTGSVNCKLKSDIPGKWNTTFDMLTKFSKNKIFLLSAIEQLHLNHFQLSPSDFEILDCVIELLIIFNSIRVELSSEKTVPLSKVPHMVRFIDKHITNILEKKDIPSQVIIMGSRLKEELKKLAMLEKNEIVCQSVLLDPRFKRRGMPSDLFEEACLSLRHKVVSVREEIMKEKTIEISFKPKPARQIAESEYFIDMWSEFESEEPCPQQNLTVAAMVEIDAFLSDEYLPMESNPLTYWVDISNQNKYPALFELAKRLLCVPATSVFSERMYSKRGCILSEKRNHMSSKNLKQILFLHHNL